MAVIAATFTRVAHAPVMAITAVCALAASACALVPALQTRLMDAARGAQSLAGALNQSALNIGNALGAWLGGVAIATGHRYTATGWVGSALAAGGLALAATSVAVERRRRLRARVTAPAAAVTERGT